MHAPRAALALALLAPAFHAVGGDLAPYRCEARGGHAWREYRTAHLVVATDVSGSRAAALVNDLEQLHALVVQALVGEQVDVPGKLRVVAFADPADFRRLARSDFAAAYARRDWLWRPTIVFPVEGFQADPEVVAHELAHHVSWHLFPRQPRWFSEGLAQFVQTVGRPREQAAPRTGTHLVHGGRESGGHWVGLAPRTVLEYLRDLGNGMPEDLLRWKGTGSTELSDRYYAWSWLLYHWMWNTRSKAFTDFTNRLADAEAPDDAWRAAFPDLDPAAAGGTRALSEALERYRRDGRFVSYEVKAPFDARSTVTPLPPAEVHALVLDARMRELDEAHAAAESNEAWQEDPTQPETAMYVARYGDPREALRKAAAARPNDWRAWYLLSTHLTSEAEWPEKESMLRKAVALEPDAAVARNALAWFLYERDRPKEAITHANAAVDLAPWSAPAIDTLAAVASALGKCKEALVLQRRAVALLPAGEQRKSYQERLAGIESRCTASRPAAAPAR